MSSSFSPLFPLSLSSSFSLRQDRVLQNREESARHHGFFSSFFPSVCFPLRILHSRQGHAARTLGRHLLVWPVHDVFDEEAVRKSPFCLSLKCSSRSPSLDLSLCPGCRARFKLPSSLFSVSVYLRAFHRIFFRGRTNKKHRKKDQSTDPKTISRLTGCVCSAKIPPTEETRGTNLHCTRVCDDPSRSLPTGKDARFLRLEGLRSAAARHRKRERESGTHRTRTTYTRGFPTSKIQSNTRRRFSTSFQRGGVPCRCTDRLSLCT